MRLHTKIVAGFLAAVMIVASTATTNVHAAPKKTVTVSTQAQLDKALANKKVAKIVVKTEKSVKIAINSGDYKDKQLLVDSPKITISNKGNFKSIVITDAKKVSDSAKGNKITLKDTNGLTFCATKASKDTKINIAAKNTKVDLVIDGKPKEIKISAKSSVVIDGNTKAITPVVVSAKATNTNIELNVAAKLETPVKIGVAVNDGGAKSTISTTKENISVTVTNNTEQKIKVADAGGKTVTVKAGASVTANVTKGTTKKAEPVIVTETAKTDEKSKDEVSESEKDTASEQEKDSTSEQKKDTTEESKEEQSDTSVKDTTSEDKKDDVSYVPPTPSYPVAHEHNWVIDVAAKKATCTEDGCTEGKHCSGCNMVIASQVEQKLGHDMQPVANTSKLNTCTEDGKESDYKCSRCEHKVEGAVIPKTGHSIVSDAAVDATCTTNGKTAGSYCSVCDTIIIKQESIQALGHDYDKEFTVDKAATCTVAGSKSRHCSRCEATTDEIEIPVTEHTPVAVEAKAATCTEEGYEAGTKCSVCDTVITGCGVIPATGNHDWEYAGQHIEPTCTECGWELTEVCSECGETRGGGSIPALGHDLHDIEGTAIEPTCKVEGKEADKACSRCDHTESGKTIPVTEHTPESVEAVEATCTADGCTAGTKCSVCDAIITGCEVIEALGHDLVTDMPLSATCTATGLTEGEHCSRCGEVLVEQETTDALGHDLHDVEGSAVEPTCTGAGKMKQRCSRCGESFVTEIPALGHTWSGAFCEVCGAFDDAYAPPEDPGENPEEDWGNPDNCNHDFESSGEYIGATCTEDGCDVGRICVYCGYFEAGEVIKALGHNFSTEYTIDKEATCKEKGSKSKHCSRCDATTDATEIPTKEHDQTGEVAYRKEPTCKMSGYEDVICSVCGTTVRTILKATGHTSVAVDAKAATCTEEGYEAGTKCSVCGEILSGCETIPALGHDMQEVEGTAKEPTCTEVGKKADKACSREGCDYKETGDEIFELGHDWDCAHCNRCGAVNSNYSGGSDPGLGDGGGE